MPPPGSVFCENFRKVVVLGVILPFSRVLHRHTSKVPVKSRLLQNSCLPFSSQDIMSHAFLKEQGQNQHQPNNGRLPGKQLWQEAWGDTPGPFPPRNNNRPPGIMIEHYQETKKRTRLWTHDYSRSPHLKKVELGAGNSLQLVPTAQPGVSWPDLLSPEISQG